MRVSPPLMAAADETMMHHPPYGAYAGIMATFLGGIAATGVVAYRLRRMPAEQSWLDLAVLGLATFKAARTLARDEVTSFIREPFVQGTPAEPEQEEPVRTGDLRQAVGELVTCSRCVGTWIAAGIAGADVLSPRFGRTLSWALAVGGVNDFLQAGFSALAGAANRVQTD
jgi:Protein of unknown function (DUF1360)